MYYYILLLLLLSLLLFLLWLVLLWLSLYNVSLYICQGQHWQYRTVLLCMFYYTLYIVTYALLYYVLAHIWYYMLFYIIMIYCIFQGREIHTHPHVVLVLNRKKLEIRDIIICWVFSCLTLHTCLGVDVLGVDCWPLVGWRFIFEHSWMMKEPL